MRSHWQDVLIESLEPPPSPPLELYLRNEKLMLASPDAIYSLEDDYLSYAEALHGFPQILCQLRCLCLVLDWVAYPSLWIASGNKGPGLPALS